MKSLAVRGGRDKGACMELYQLRSFVAAAETESITQAAGRVHLSQPALSRQIAQLEDEVGVALFERRRQRIHLTAAGREFLLSARQLLADADGAVQQLRERFGKGEQTLRLGLIGPFLDDLVAPALRRFRQKHPSIRVRLQELPPQPQLDQLLAGDLDAGVLGNIQESLRHRFHVQELSRHRIAAVVPEGHPLAGREQIDLAELAGDDWVSLANRFYPERREFLESCCAEVGFQPRMVTEADSLPLMLAAVATGSGVGILPDHARKLPHAGVVFLRLARPVISTSLLLVVPRRPMPAGLAELSDLLAEQAATLADA